MVLNQRVICAQVLQQSGCLLVAYSQLIACGMRGVAAGAYVVFVRGAANEKCINVCMYALNCRGRCCWLPDGKRSGTNAHMLKQS